MTDAAQAYRERNVLVAALARLFPSGLRRTDIEGWDPEWHGCVYIDLPTGQISYHYHDSEAHLFAGLPPYEKPWDGHDKETVHDRLMALTPPPPMIAAGDFEGLDLRIRAFHLATEAEIAGRDLAPVCDAQETAREAS